MIDGGAGILLHDSSMNINNCTIAHNIACILACSNEYNAGGISARGQSYANIINSVVWGNLGWLGEPDQIGPDYWTGNGGILYSDVSYTDVQDGWEGVSNIDANPLFTNSEEYDYTLLVDSPCIDSGDPESPYDPDNTVTDMGAFYYYQEPECGDLPGDQNLDGEVNILDVVILAGCIIELYYDCECGDINNDDIVNVLDVVLVVNIILEIDP